VVLDGSVEAVVVEMLTMDPLILTVEKVVDLVAHMLVVVMVEVLLLLAMDGEVKKELTALVAVVAVAVEDLKVLVVDQE
jgi:hypothetical protein